MLDNLFFVWYTKFEMVNSINHPRCCLESVLYGATCRTDFYIKNIKTQWNRPTHSIV